jgi:ATP-dependent RNA helicase DeaD
MQTFEQTGISPLIIKAIKELGFEIPTEIQKQSIPQLLNESRDLVALAQTGTGKTAAFGLPIIEKINTELKHTQALILAPTRELCVQISKDIKSYSKYIPHLKVATVYGGASAEKQIEELKSGCQIAVGTPGRVLDLITRKKLKVEHIEFLVLDEADEMLDMGFKEELDAILEGTPPNRQTLLFSATMPNEILKIAKKYMSNAVEISVGEKNSGAENVKHHYYLSPAKDRFNVLKRIIDAHPNIYSIVFCRTRTDTKEVADKLIESGYNADALHGDLSQAQRDYVMNRFHIKHLQILVATDVAARGLDVDNLTHIINYNIPDEAKIYIHRSGRTGRAGKSGTSISLVHTRELYRLKEMERLLGKSFKRKLIPGGTEICERQLFNLVDKVEHTEVDEKQIEPYMDVIYKKLNWLSREELISKFVSVEFSRFLSFYKDAPDLNIYEDDIKGKSKDRDRTSGKKTGNSGPNKGGYSRFFINLGSNKSLSASKLIGLINDQTKQRDINIGKIEILKSFSFFEVESSFEQEMIKAFDGCKYKGMNISVELSKEKPGMPRPSDHKHFGSKKRKDKKK